MPADRIGRAYDHYKCQLGLLRNLEQRAGNAGAPRFLQLVEFPGLTNLPPSGLTRDTQITRTLKELYDKIEEETFLNLISLFEGEIFNRIGVAAGAIKQIVAAQYVGDDHTMSRFRRGFVKDVSDVYNLGGLTELFHSGPLPDALRDRLKDAIDYRDYLAHGKRIKVVEVKNQPQPPTVDDTVRLLRDLLALC